MKIVIIEYNNMIGCLCIEYPVPHSKTADLIAYCRMQYIAWHIHTVGIFFILFYIHTVVIFLFYFLFNIRSTRFPLINFCIFVRVVQRALGASETILNSESETDSNKTH